MAYRLKTITYLGANKKILLQNENGPCPLIACANVLLLRGVLQLPATCIRNDVVSIDDLVNILAERALKQTSSREQSFNSNTNTVSSPEDNTNVGENLECLIQGSSVSPQTAAMLQEYHLNDLLNTFPLLQYGMDVNPKFTTGPFGVEYTKNIELFDLLGVEICHGWLLDPQDIETASIIDRKSYNELALMVIQGQEAFSEIHHLDELISSKEDQLHILLESSDKASSGGGEDYDKTIQDHEQNNSLQSENTELDHNSSTHKIKDDSGLDKNPYKSEVLDVSHDSIDCTSSAIDTCSDIVSEMMSADDGLLFKPTITLEECQREIIHLRDLHGKMTHLITTGAIIDSFFIHTGHQLTYYGLHELVRVLEDDCLYVFFRNNHFSTITKHEAELYLLVTDLGYGNVNDVIWEKLDTIDGDTEYFDSFFKKTQSKYTIDAAPGPSLSPEVLLAQTNQTEADYHVALQLSKNGEKTLDEQEGWLLSAATEASIIEWMNGKEKSSTKDVSLVDHPSTHEPSNTEASDQALARELAAQFESERHSEHLAHRQTSEEQWRAAELRRNVSQANADRKANRSNSFCIIS